MNILLYSEKASPRLSYIIDCIGSRISGQPVTITTDKTTFQQADAIRINYSAQQLTDNEIRIVPHGLLFENSISPQAIQCFDWKGHTAFFPTEGSLPFDLFAAAFYLVTRYEEYLPHEKDLYGRYAHTNSIAFTAGFLHLPLVDIWVQELARFIKSTYPSVTTIPATGTFRYIPTYDIDIAFSYKGKGLLRNLGASLRSSALRDITHRIAVLTGNRKDPFDVYDWLDALHEKHHLQPVYFYLLARMQKGYDKNIPPHAAVLQQLVRRHAALHYQTGIHPSWQSGDNAALLKEEISCLETMVQHSITMSRQHYIRMQLPATYRMLLQHGIEQDYSMGYGSTNGFRASTSNSFNWYDLDADTTTALQVYPFCYMEANSFFEQHYSAAMARKELQQYHDVVQSVNGTLMTIFHNHFLTEEPQWIAWRNMYAAYLQDNFS